MFLTTKPSVSPAVRGPNHTGILNFLMKLGPLCKPTLRKLIDSLPIAHSNILFYGSDYTELMSLNLYSPFNSESLHLNSKSVENDHNHPYS